MNIPLSDALDLVRSSNYQESELDQILDLISCFYGIHFQIYIDSKHPDKVVAKITWDPQATNFYFTDYTVITHEFKYGIKKIFGKDSRQAKEFALSVLIGNTLYGYVDSFARMNTIPVCEIPAFSCLNELKLKLAIMKG